MKKGLLDNVFSSVLMVILFLVFGFIMFSNTSKDIVRYFQNSEQIFLDEHFSNSLNTALKVDEPITMEPMSRLVTKRVFYRKEVLDIDGQLVNITDEFRKILDEVYGPDEYFVEVKALIYDLTLIFVFDGSDSMREERAEIADKLPSIIEQLKQQTNFTIAEYVYVLSNKDPRGGLRLCDMFVDRDLTCEVIDYQDIYLPFYQNCADEDHPNADYRAKHCIIAPFVHNRWERNNRQRPWQEYSQRWRENYYTVDWGSGIAYALAQTSTALSNLNIVFPISEELSTSSFAQRCYTNYEDGNQNYRAVTCDICEPSDNDATIERAYRSVEGALRMSDDVLNDVMFPIYSYQDPCEYLYFGNNRHACIQYTLGGGTPSDGTWCGDSRCMGCQDVGSRSGAEYVCFHPEVRDITLGHMQELADATAGSVVMIADKDKLADIINVKINDTLNNLFFTIGTKQNNTRYGFERMLTLPGLVGNFARLRLEVY
jgi:hypothetical protein